MMQQPKLLKVGGGKENLIFLDLIFEWEFYFDQIFFFFIFLIYSIIIFTGIIIS